MTIPFYEEYLSVFIENALKEDVGDGDHTSLACIPETKKGTALLISKDSGIIAGIEIAKNLFSHISNEIKISAKLNDGDNIKPKDLILTIEGKVLDILKGERLMLNIMQRMSGIATKTNQYTKELQGLKAKVLDTRKTTPGMRMLEKEAVKIGGGCNHRMGLFDMIMLKDNHIDFSGGIEAAISRTKKYLHINNKQLKIEIEARSIENVKEIIKIGGVDRIMLDNFSIKETEKAVNLIDGKFETESSGGITIETIRAYGETGVDFISVGALTHQIQSLDMSLIAKF